MTRKLSLWTIVIAAALVAMITAIPNTVRADMVVGPRAGLDFDSDDLVLGAEAELGQVFGEVRFAPSIDFEFADNTTTALNSDFRLYLFDLPDTGLRFYGSAGPSVFFYSAGGGNHTEVGLSLVAGLSIPMKGNSRYGVETRFGFGDIPDFKATFAILFGI
jgi:hypothetical protein